MNFKIQISLNFWLKKTKMLMALAEYEIFSINYLKFSSIAIILTEDY